MSARAPRGSDLSCVRTLASSLARSTGDNGIGCRSAPVKCFQPVADRILKYDQIGDMAFVRERWSAPGYLDPRRIEATGEFSQRSLVRDLPSEEPDPIAVVFVHDETLLAIVHPKRDRRAALVHALHSEL